MKVITARSTAEFCFFGIRAKAMAMQARLLLAVLAFTPLCNALLAPVGSFPRLRVLSARLGAAGAPARPQRVVFSRARVFNPRMSAAPFEVSPPSSFASARARAHEHFFGAALVSPFSPFPQPCSVAGVMASSFSHSSTLTTK